MAVYSMDSAHDTQDYYIQMIPIVFDFDVDMKVWRYFTYMDIISQLGGLGAMIQGFLASFAAYFTIQFFLSLGNMLQKLAMNEVKIMKINKCKNHLKKHGTFFEEANIDSIDYDQVDNYLKYLKSSCKDCPLPETDELEAEIIRIKKQQASKSPLEMIQQVKQRVSIFQIFKFHDRLIQNQAEIEYLKSKCLSLE